MVAQTSPLTRADDESLDLSSWEYRPNLALRHDPIVYEAASLKHPLPCRLPNEAGRPLTYPRQRARMNRALRKTERNRNSRRSLLRPLLPGSRRNLTRGPSSTGF